MKLQIVIPALNEQDSIGSIIERTLAARQVIISETAVNEVAITVVSDGSTDRTVDIAKQYAKDVHLIVFVENRGYGAAIMEGWRQSDADLLSFLDADGTCDPRFFVALCNAMRQQHADVALGCRMNSNSQMPLLRKVGNLGFAWMLRVFGSTEVRDAASGMRVVRRSCLPRLMPLPTGLHFTPAMSARAILADDLKIVEIDMPYAEREGRSKLNPLRDGWRFLKVILSTAFLYRPSRPLGMVALMMVLFAVLWLGRLVWHITQIGEMRDFMIYHFLVIELSTLGGLLLLSAGHLGRKAVGITISAKPQTFRRRGLLGWLLNRRWFWWVPVALIVLGIVLIVPTVRDYLATGRVTFVSQRWPAFFGMSFTWMLAFILTATRLVDITLNLLHDRLQYLRTQSVAENDFEPDIDQHDGAGTRADRAQPARSGAR